MSSNAPPAPANNAPSGLAARLLPFFDVAAKLIAAGAVVGTTIIASSFQSSMTASNLLSQREQADSSLRANMFHDLIGQMLGQEKLNGEIPVDRERLLVELLALNFHEHFELKPVMNHVDDRLAHEPVREMTGSRRGDPRESLRSVARRVLQRQLAMLTQADGSVPAAQQACVYRLDLSEATARSSTEDKPVSPCSLVSKYFGDLIGVDSPNGLYTLAFTVSTPEKWADQDFAVSMRISGKAPDGEGKTVSADYDFRLTWFDFPFTDNTLLADGTRFSLILDDVNPEKKKATFKLVWFPQDYFSARERPTNHRQFRKKLGIELK
ncbi:MAG: hypothetical protein HY067_20940 [Betaproteobacteria bacterium]|nr:hypothetical protein [Betaproteobacteria bacterium]